MPVAPYGSWPSPITSQVLVQEAVRLSDVRVVGDSVWWSEGRPQEGGRQVLVKAMPGSEPVDVLPAPFSARTSVHEYGGAAYAVHADVVFFSNFADQRLWRLHPTEPPRPITSKPSRPRATRFGDLVVSEDGQWVVCVRERHFDGRQGVNDLVAVAASGEGDDEPVVLAAGRDFFSAPRLSGDGRLAWLCWDHPNMPWDGTDLWVAEVTPQMDVRNARRVVGGPEESISQPRWSPEGVLHWVSDRSGWWNLYTQDGRRGEPLAEMRAEFAGPDWIFGQSTYTFLQDGTLVATWRQEGVWKLGVVTGGRAQPLSLPFTDFSALQSAGQEVVAVAASHKSAPAVVGIDVASGDTRTIRASRVSELPEGAISEPEAIVFPTTGGQTAHAFFYRPVLEGFEAPPGERPPLIVRSHGGPTGSATSALNPEFQFWTSRGFAVVDVDYGGSAGYGRDYRRRLDGQWGIVDLDDCVNAALHLASQGEVDADRMVVRGGSAGGYTTLCALTFRDRFAAGASYYGVADLETLAKDTHKFESRYLDRLVGHYPEAHQIYRERSPIHFADRIRVPVILFQGLEDAVVPPSQAEVLVAALRRNGLPFSYVTFEGEQHGFRQASTIRRAVEAELWFYGQVLGFTPAENLDGVEIENGDRLTTR
jgi:dipeptidyl aminopeptidase/acylaminoacyl peptidase